GGFLVGLLLGHGVGLGLLPGVLGRLAQLGLGLADGPDVVGGERVALVVAGLQAGARIDDPDVLLGGEAFELGVAGVPGVDVCGGSVALTVAGLVSAGLVSAGLEVSSFFASPWANRWMVPVRASTSDSDRAIVTKRRTGAISLLGASSVVVLIRPPDRRDVAE